MTSRSGSLAAEWLGTRPYREMLAEQERLVERRQSGEAPDTLLLLEHPSTFTLGRRSQPSDRSGLDRTPEAEVVETANLSNYDIVTMADVNGFRVSLQANGEWHLIRKADRQVTVVGYNLRDAVAIINPTPETFAQGEIERGYAAQEAEEHAAWVESQTEEEVNVIEDDDTMTVMMAAMVLNDKRTGDATEEEIDEAQGVAVARRILGRATP